MKTNTIATLTLLLTGLLGTPARAALHDMGPMGNSASGAPTPDAAVLSKSRLPDLPTPAPTTMTASTLVQISAARKMRAHARWLDIQSLSQRIKLLTDSGKLSLAQGDSQNSELSAIQDKYRFHLESDGFSLSPRQNMHLRAELSAFSRKLPRHD